MLLLILISRNSAKVAIAGGAVYYTVKQGVWSDTGEGSAALENVRETILPATATEYISKVSLKLETYACS